MSDKIKKSRPIIGYMCKVDFDWELGEAADGCKIFASIAGCKRERKCVEECGIVEVEVRLRKIVQEGTI